MRNALIATVFMLSVGLSGPALAAPPSDAMPLSEIIATIESQADFAHVDEIEWDDDGHWDVEYYRTDGSKVSVEIDPVSGQARR